MYVDKMTFKFQSYENWVPRWYEEITEEEERILDAQGAAKQGIILAQIRQHDKTTVTQALELEVASAYKVQSEKIDTSRLPPSVQQKVKDLRMCWRCQCYTYFMSADYCANGNCILHV
jgi:hypothetical protein